MVQNIYSSMHGSLNTFHGFIVPPRVSIRVYGVPGYINIDYCGNVDGREHIEYKSGDFMYDIDYEEENPFSGRDINPNTILLNKTGANVGSKPQDRFFMFRGMTDEQVDEMYLNGRYVYMDGYSLSKLCFDTLFNNEEIVIHSFSCMGLQEKLECEEIFDYIDVLTSTGSKISSVMYDLYDINAVLRYFYPSYNLNLENICVSINALENQQLILDLYHSKINDSLLEFLDNNKIHYSLGNEFIYINSTVESINNFFHNVKPVLKNQTIRDYSTYYRDGKRKSIKIEYSKYNNHSGNKLLNLFRTTIDNFKNNPCTLSFVNFILNYETQNKYDVVIIPYKTLCILLKIIGNKQLSDQGEIVMCLINKISEINLEYYNNVWLKVGARLSYLERKIELNERKGGSRVIKAGYIAYSKRNNSKLQEEVNSCTKLINESQKEHREKLRNSNKTLMDEVDKFYSSTHS